MRYLMMLTLSLVLFGCKTMEPLTQEQKTITVIKEAKGLDKFVLFDSTKVWIAETFRSAKAVLELADKERGIIIGNGISDYPCEGLSCMAKGDWKLHYSMRVDFKDDKYKVSFSNLQISWPGSYSGGISTSAHHGPVNNQGDYEEIKVKLLALADNLENTITTEKKNSDW